MAYPPIFDSNTTINEQYLLVLAIRIANSEVNIKYATSDLYER